MSSRNRPALPRRTVIHLNLWPIAGVLAAAVSMLSIGDAQAQQPTVATYASTCPAIDPRSLSLAAAVRHAACLDPSLGLADAELRQQQAVAEERRTARRSTWSVSASPTQSLQLSSDRSVRTTSVSGALTVNRTVLDGGARQARIEQSERDTDAVAADRTSDERDAVLGFIDLWAQARNADAAVAALAESVRSAKTTTATVSARLAAGLATQVDLLRSQSAEAQAERDALAGLTEQRRIRGVLAQRLGLAADQALVLSGDDRAALHALPAAAAAAGPGTDGSTGVFPALLDEQRRIHPQLQAQRGRLAALQANLNAARAEHAPTLALTGQTGPSWSHSSAASVPGVDSGGSRWTTEVGLRWSMPLSDGGARDSRIAQALALIDGGRSRLDILQRNLSDTLWQRLTDWQDADAALKASDLALDAARAAEEATNGRYRAGVGTLTDVIAAQSDVAQRSRQRSQADQQRLRSHAALLHALGHLPITLTAESR